MSDRDQITVPEKTGACLFCNTIRPIEQVLCPECGRGWIDTVAAESGETVARAEARSIRTVATHRAPAVRRSGHRPGWWIPAAAALVVFGAYWGFVSLAGGDDTAAATTVTVPTTISATPTPVVAPPTTLPPAPSTTTTSPSTTTPTTTTPTTSTTPTTTTTLPPLPVGTPVAIGDLSLGALGIGDFAFGGRAEGPLADLVATFGQPDAIEPADTSWGLCEGTAGRIITFGGLAVITEDDGGVERLAGFVLEPADADSSQLRTISGVGIDATIGRLASVYTVFEVVDDPGGVVWIVTSPRTGRTLLWGTAPDGADDTVITSMASPRSCDDGPRA